MAAMLPKDKNILIIAGIGGAGLALFMWLSSRSKKPADIEYPALAPPHWWTGGLLNGPFPNPSPIDPIRPPPAIAGGSKPIKISPRMIDPFTPGPGRGGQRDNTPPSSIQGDPTGRAFVPTEYAKGAMRVL